MTTRSPAHPADSRLVLCSSFDEYCFACLRRDGGSSALPVLAGDSPEWLGTEWLGAQWLGDAGRIERASADSGWLPSSHALARHAARWERLSWPERAAEVLAASRARVAAADYGSTAASVPQTVLAAAGPTAVVAAVLAAYLGADLDVPTSGLRERALELLRVSSSPLVLVASRVQATDDVLFGLLDESDATLNSLVAWGELPRYCLVAGRDLESLSWVAAKVIWSRHASGKRVRRLVHYVATGKSCIRSELLMRGTSPVRSATAELDSASIQRSIRERADVVAYQTHGSDACAQGGGGVVLCGLRAQGLTVVPRSPGTLACGHGHACPRGPHPVPLKQWPVETLMIASCNGLRLADSALEGDFNLGLSFLDGGGLAYVSSIFSSLVTDACPVVFLSALAANRDLAEAVTILNAFVCAAGVDKASYIAVGAPDFQPTGPCLHRSVCDPVKAGERTWTADFRATCMTEIVVADPSLLALLRHRRLALSITTPEMPGNVYWFGRVEQIAADQGGSPNASQVARLFVFRFPVPFGRVEFSSWDITELEHRVRYSVAALSRVLEFWRLSGIASKMPDAYQELRNAESHAAQEVVQLLMALRFDGLAPGNVDQYVTKLASVARAARDVLLDALLPELAGSFYLTNMFADEYRFTGATPSRCPYCAGLAMDKLFRHPLTDEGRLVEVCARCAIIADVAESGAIRRVRIDSPDGVLGGDELPVRVSVEISKQDGQAGVPEEIEIAVACRVTTFGSMDIHIPTKPDRIVNVVAAGTIADFEFSVPIPSGLPPHTYSTKVLVASSHELAFARRLLSVY